MPRRPIKPNQIIVLSFICASIIGAVILCLPISTRGSEPISIVDALFTSTSAVCVTGLTVKDTGAFFTPFGQIAILTLIQLGGLGIMTFSTAFAVLLGRRLTIKETVIMRDALDNQKVSGFPSLIKHILLVTFLIEFLGALLLFFRWHISLGRSVAYTIYTSIFHSVAAFCNAGFSLFSDNLCSFSSDAPVTLIITSLIILGGIGFVVLLDVPKLKFYRKDRIKYLSKISLQSKLAVSATVILIVIGMIFILLFEWGNTLKGMPLKEKLLCSYFHSVTPRTAGFNTLPVEKFASPTLFVTIVLMFIGAAPGSTGGGIKTVTLAVLLAAAVAIVKNRDRITVFKKTVPRPIFRRAFIISLLSLGWVFFVTIVICLIESSRLGQPDFALRNIFEAVSAFGTVGLSAALTPTLSGASKALLIITMLLGRVGPLTLALAIATVEQPSTYTYPEERIMVG